MTKERFFFVKKIKLKLCTAQFVACALADKNYRQFWGPNQVATKNAKNAFNFVLCEVAISDISYLR